MIAPAVEHWRTRSIPFVTLIEAAEELGIQPATLRHMANLRRDGGASEQAMAGRLEIQKLPGGRDWLIPRERLLEELERR